LAWRQRGFASRDAPAQIRYFTRAIELDPKDADALAARGRAHVATGETRLARADLTAALALAPETSDWYGDRGLTELLQNDDKGAAADFQRCAALDPHCVVSFGARITAVETAQNRTPRDWFSAP
jgi:Flp pilus assembly protein TadD